VVLAAGYRETDPVGDAGGLGAAARCRDRRRVVVETDERRARIGLGEENSGRPVAAPDVRHQRALPQLRLHAIEGRNPGLDEMGLVAGAEEALDSVEQAVVVLVPANTRAAGKGLHELWLDTSGGHCGLEGADEEGRAGLVGEQERLLGRETVAARDGIVVHVAAGRLGIQPLPNVAL